MGYVYFSGEHSSYVRATSRATTTFGRGLPLCSDEGHVWPGPRSASTGQVSEVVCVLPNETEK